MNYDMKCLVKQYIISTFVITRKKQRAITIKATSFASDE